MSSLSMVEGRTAAHAALAQVAGRMALGEQRFDEAHEEFAGLASQLASAPESDVFAALEQLQRHAAAHFAEEDIDLRALGGEANECHLDEHTAVLASMDEVRALREAGVPGAFEVARRLGRELAAWLPRHVEEMDLRLAQSLFRRRTGGARLHIVPRAKAQAPGPGA